MKFQGFVGPTYASRTSAADVQRAMNLYPEAIESGQGKNSVILLGTPGLAIFDTLEDWPVRALWSGNGRCFCVAGGVFYELKPDGTHIQRGNVSRQGAAQIVSNGIQLLVMAGTAGYLYTFGSDTLTQVSAEGFNGASAIGYVDGYFLAVQPGTGQFSFSGLLAGGEWDGLDFASAEGAPDKLVGMAIDHRQIILGGEESTEIWWNMGGADLPFQRVEGGFIEQGWAAAQSAAKVDNSVFWLAQSTRGKGSAVRLNGYTPQRISNHAVEYVWGVYPTISDAIGYGYEDGGHSFVAWSFPSGGNLIYKPDGSVGCDGAGATWVYDCATGMWHERGYWDATHGNYRAHRGRVHCYAWGKHLVGDWLSGNVYEMSQDFYDDAGEPLRRMRQAPHISNENQWMFYQYLQLDIEAGKGLATGQGSDPRLMLDWSDDYAHTWSQEHWCSAGKTGEYKYRAMWRRLGRSRDRVFRVTYSEPTPIAFVNAYLGAEQGIS